MKDKYLRKSEIHYSLSEVLRDAGRAIMNVYGSFISVTLKNDQSPLTEADERSHEIISEYLKRHYPFPILSEEGKAVPYQLRKNWEQFWLVDPLDGTKEFVKRNGEFTVNIALIRKNRPVIGAIYVPALDVLYFAEKGGGSYKTENGTTKRLPLSMHSGFTIVGSRSHASPDFDNYLRVLEQRHGTVQVIPAGSSLKFCLVAEGKANLYPRLGPTMEWDTAAGQMIVEEAGGRVMETGSSRSLSYNKESLINPFFIAANNLPAGIV
jgi:3'(2'), 5'-bisphosphate nucleotidase